MIRFSTPGILLGHGEPGAYPRRYVAQGRIHHGRDVSPSQGTIINTLKHPFIYYRQFRDASQTTLDVLGLGKETGIPGEHPGIHTHGKGLSAFFCICKLTDTQNWLNLLRFTGVKMYGILPVHPFYQFCTFGSRTLSLEPDGKRKDPIKYLVH